MSNLPWYPFYPGDYARDTAHLSLIEHGAYRLLLDHYYSTGGPLPANADRLHKICRAVADAEKDAVLYIVQEFFTETEGGYINERADIVIIKAAQTSEKRAKAAKKSHEKRGCKSSAIADAGHVQSDPEPDIKTLEPSLSEGSEPPSDEKPDEGDKPKVKIKTYPSFEAFRLAGGLADFILFNNPENTELKNGKMRTAVLRWSLDFDKMLRLDGLEFETVARVLKWCQKDPFWQKNILSGSKFRDKYNELSMKAKDNGSVVKTASAAKSRDDGTMAAIARAAQRMGGVNVEPQDLLDADGVNGRRITD
jgi:uncharacterized protein YdaU (DUF1376 family)